MDGSFAGVELNQLLLRCVVRFFWSLRGGFLVLA